MPNHFAALSWMDVACAELELTVPRNRRFDGPDYVIGDGVSTLVIELKWSSVAGVSTRASALKFWLDAALWAKRTKSALDEVLEHRAAVELGLRLLSTSEEVTGIPSITAAATSPGLAAVWGNRLLPSLGELSQVEEEVERFWHVAVTLLADLLGTRPRDYGPHAPPHDSSPCGVIRLASPLVPRGPDGPAYLPDPSSLCVLAV
ncbi:hypothetical protein AB0K49_16090 [Streptomyces decoyicus]|uniref:hypothetical protein n=1 Tax=Streptomyces decoyicus TaxID=249567 RepID=UPI00345C7C94